MRGRAAIRAPTTFRIEMAAAHGAVWALCTLLWFTLLLVAPVSGQSQPTDSVYWNDTFDWQQSDGNASIVRITSTGVADSNGNVYVAGSKTYIDPLDGSVGDENVFVACINADDELLWTREVMSFALLC